MPPGMQTLTSLWRRGWSGRIASLPLSFLPAIRSLERRARYLFYCMFYFVCQRFLDNPPIHAKFCMWAYSGSGCVFSPFGGWRPPAGGKRGKWNFRYYGSQWGIFAVWRFLSDISATRGRIHTKFYLYRDNVCRRAPSSCGVHRPLGIGQLPFLFSQRCQM